MRTRSQIVGAAALVLALTLAGCGGGDDSDAAETTTTTEEEVEETTTTTEAEEESTTTSEAEEPESDDPSNEDLLAVIEPLVITADEISDQFGTGEWEADVDSSSPCDQDPDDTYPPAAQTGTVVGSDDLNLYLRQDIRVYSTIGDAEAVLELAAEAFSCGADTTDPSLELGPVTDVSDEVGVDAFAVEVLQDGDPGSLIVALYSDVVVSFQFVGDGDVAATEGIPSPLEVATFGVEKIITGLE